MVEKNKKLVFTSVIFPRDLSETNALLLAESIRKFAGSLSKNPIWYYFPDYGEQISKPVRDRLLSLDVFLIPFEVDPTILRFPFAGHIKAATLSESKAVGVTNLLVWLGANTVVVKEPEAFKLHEKKSLGST